MRKRWTSPAPSARAATAMTSSSAEKAPVAPAVYTRAGATLPDSATRRRCRPAFERGLHAFFSTFEVNGIRITAGKPPPPARPRLGAHSLLVADPDYYGKIRVLLYNLRQGVARIRPIATPSASPRAEVEAAAKKHFAARQFPDHVALQPPDGGADFPERQVSDTEPHSRAPTCWPGRNPPRNIRSCSAGHEQDRRSRRGTRTARATRGPQR